MKSEVLDTLNELARLWNIIDWKAIFTLISLIIAFRVNRFFYRREIRKKQIDLVIELVQNIQKKPIWLRWIKQNDKSTSAIELTSGSLFSISRMSKIASSSEVKELKVYFSMETIHRLNITDFLTNPLLPREIADALKKSFTAETIHVGLNNTHTDFIYLDELRTLDAKALKEDFPLEKPDYYCTYFINFSDFISGLVKMRNATNKWFNRSRIKDLNIYWED